MMTVAQWLFLAALFAPPLVLVLAVIGLLFTLPKRAKRHLETSRAPMQIH